MMFNVVDKNWGTAHSIKDPLLKMAGKTGTGRLIIQKECTIYFKFCRVLPC